MRFKGGGIPDEIGDFCPHHRAADPCSPRYVYVGESPIRAHTIMGAAVLCLDWTSGQTHA